VSEPARRGVSTSKFANIEACSGFHCVELMFGAQVRSARPLAANSVRTRRIWPQPDAELLALLHQSPTSLQPSPRMPALGSRWCLARLGFRQPNRSAVLEEPKRGARLGEPCLGSFDLPDKTGLIVAAISVETTLPVTQFFLGEAHPLARLRGVQVVQHKQLICGEVLGSEG